MADKYERYTVRTTGLAAPFTVPREVLEEASRTGRRRLRDRGRRALFAAWFPGTWLLTPEDHRAWFDGYRLGRKYAEALGDG